MEVILLQEAVRHGDIQHMGNSEIPFPGLFPWVKDLLYVSVGEGITNVLATYQELQNVNLQFGYASELSKLLQKDQKYTILHFYIH